MFGKIIIIFAILLGTTDVEITHLTFKVLACLDCTFVCREAYPTCQVIEVNLCYDVAKLIDLDRNR